jgi:hypothetical protein
MTPALALDELNHDIYVDPTTHRLVRLTDFAAIVAQRIKCRFLTVLGEWYQDPTIGVPLFDQVLVKNPDLIALKHLFTSVASGVPGVASVDSMNLSFDSAARKLSIQFAATASDGTTATGSL